jgi:hypothetical protein
LFSDASGKGLYRTLAVNTQGVHFLSEIEPRDAQAICRPRTILENWRHRLLWYARRGDCTRFDGRNMALSGSWGLASLGKKVHAEVCAKQVDRLQSFRYRDRGYWGRSRQPASHSSIERPRDGVEERSACASSVMICPSNTSFRSHLPRLDLAGGGWRQVPTC